jgi:hypothetical protein
MASTFTWHRRAAKVGIVAAFIVWLIQPKKPK